MNMSICPSDIYLIGFLQRSGSLCICIVTYNKEIINSSQVSESSFLNQKPHELPLKLGGFNLYSVR